MCVRLFTGFPVSLSAPGGSCARPPVACAPHTVPQSLRHEGLEGPQPHPGQDRVGGGLVKIFLHCVSRFRYQSSDRCEQPRRWSAPCEDQLCSQSWGSWRCRCLLCCFRSHKVGDLRLEILNWGHRLFPLWHSPCFSQGQCQGPCFTMLRVCATEASKDARSDWGNMSEFESWTFFVIAGGKQQQSRIPKWRLQTQPATWWRHRPRPQPPWLGEKRQHRLRFFTLSF